VWRGMVGYVIGNTEKHLINICQTLQEIPLVGRNDIEVRGSWYSGINCFYLAKATKDAKQ